MVCCVVLCCVVVVVVRTGVSVYGWCQVAVSLTVSVLSFHVITRVVCVCACIFVDVLCI